MTDADMPGDLTFNCEWALEQVQEFLHGELSEEQANCVRMHLAGCESCLDNFDAETFITQLVRRCQPPALVPETLRIRISHLHIKCDPA